MKGLIQKAMLNAVFWPLFFLHTLIGIPLLTSLVALAAPFRSHRENMRMFRLMIARYGNLVLNSMRPWVKIKTDYPGPLIPQPCIYICNHRSASDPFLMAKLPGEIIQVVNIWPFKIPILGRFAKWAGYLSVREMPFDLFSATACRHLQNGTCIAAFPEGTRSGTDPMGPFHSAMFRIALQTGVPVVPVCISGNEQIPPKGSLNLNSGRIRIRMLPVITKETYGDWSPFVFKTRIHEMIRSELENMNRE